MTPNQPINILSGRLRERAVEQAKQTRMQQRAKITPGSIRRVSTFSPDLHVVLEVTEGASKRAFAVLPVDLTDAGISLLHGKFVAPGTPGSIVLETRGGGFRVEGRVSICDHLSGPVHELGMVFDAPIDSGVFSTDMPSASAAEINREHVGHLAMDLADAATSTKEPGRLRDLVLELMRAAHVTPVVP